MPHPTLSAHLLSAVNLPLRHNPKHLPHAQRKAAARSAVQRNTQCLFRERLGAPELQGKGPACPAQHGPKGVAPHHEQGSTTATCAAGLQEQ